MTSLVHTVSIATHPRAALRARHSRTVASEGATLTVAALLACGLVAYLSLSSPTTGDYLIGAPVAADNAAPAIAALAHGHVASFLSFQPLMGLLALLPRVPVAALTTAVGGGPGAVYHLGALVLMLPTALIAARLAVPGRDTRRPAAAGVIAAAVLLVSPPVLNGLRYGHPEEMLAATLATVSVLAACRHRPLLAGALLGAAIGTKDWAALAALPLLLGLPDGKARAKAALVGGAMTLILAAPAPLLDPAAFSRASHALGATKTVTMLSAWWPLSTHVFAHGSSVPVRGLPFGFTKAQALPLALALAGGLCVALAATGSGKRLRANGRAVDAIAVLCLLGLVRCLADTGPVEYYFVALLFPLSVWEAVVLRRLPLVTILAVAAVWLTYERAADFSPAALDALTLAWGGILACYLAYRAFAVGIAPRAQADREVQ